MLTTSFYLSFRKCIQIRISTLDIYVNQQYLLQCRLLFKQKTCTYRKKVEMFKSININYKISDNLSSCLQQFYRLDFYACLT